MQALVEEIETAMTVFAHGLNDLVKDRGETPESKASVTYHIFKYIVKIYYHQADMVRSDVSCYNSGPVPWRGGNKFR